VVKFDASEKSSDLPSLDNKLFGSPPPRRGRGLTVPRAPADVPRPAKTPGTNKRTNERANSATNATTNRLANGSANTRAPHAASTKSGTSRGEGSNARRPLTKPYVYVIDVADKVVCQRVTGRGRDRTAAREYLLNAIEAVQDQLPAAVEATWHRSEGTFDVGVREIRETATYGVRLLVSDGDRIAEMADEIGATGPSQVVQVALRLYHGRP
jgi:hypothetical protein